MSKFDNLFSSSDNNKYREQVRATIRKARNNANSARSSVGSVSFASRSNLQSPVSTIDCLLTDLMDNTPSALQSEARKRHDQFNKHVKAYNQVAKQGRPKLPGKNREQYDTKLKDAFEKVKSDLRSLLNSLVSWLDGYL